MATRGKSTSKKKKPTKKSTMSKKMPDMWGVVLSLLAFFILISCISYLYTWKVDQDKVLKHSWGLLIEPSIAIQNWLGKIGALVSHKAFYNGFGLSTLLPSLWLFLWSFAIIFRLKKHKVWAALQYTLLGLVVLPLLLEYILPTSLFPWGGAVGQWEYKHLVSLIGKIGTGVLLLCGLTAIALWHRALWWSTADVGGKRSATPAPKKEKKPFLQRFKGLKPKDIVDPFLAPSEDPALTPTAQEVVLPEDIRQDNENLVEKIRSQHTPSEEIPLLEPEAGESLTLEFEEEPVPKPKRKKPVEEPEDIELQIAEPSEDDSQLPQMVTELTQGDHRGLDEAFDPTLELSSFRMPEIDMLINYQNDEIKIDRSEIESNKNQIVTTLRHYKIEITKIRATVGPTVTLYEIVPAPGIRISKIKNLEDDIALSLAALGIRIIAPIPGKGTIGIEVPNVKKQIVGLKEVLLSDKFQKTKMTLPIALGKTISNEVFVADLAKMPHLLIAGATGQGKSVGINTVLMSLLYKQHPSQVKLVLIDPKKVELFPYSKLYNHYLAMVPGIEEPIITDTSKVVTTLVSLCTEMDERYEMLKSAHARNIKEYNKKFTDRKLNPLNGHRFLPFIVLVIDEFADLIMTAGKEIEMPIARLAQLARAVGIHLVIATQRPSVNIITGIIKANFPARLAFKVTSKIDSRTILDQGGADQLIGRGDMLLSVGGDTVRLQCAFVDTPEVEEVLDHVEGQRGFPHPYYLPEVADAEESKVNGYAIDELDDMFEDAARLVVANQHGSTSMLQRKMKLGYNRAGRIMDQLEAFGIVAENAGSKAREVLMASEYELEQHLEMIKQG